MKLKISRHKSQFRGVPERVVVVDVVQRVVHDAVSDNRRVGEAARAALPALVLEQRGHPILRRRRLGRSHGLQRVSSTPHNECHHAHTGAC